MLKLKFQLPNTSYYILVISVFILDRYFKDYSNLPKTINRGISFSISLNPYLLITICLLLILVIIFVTKFYLLNTKYLLPIFFILLGGLSNLLDRYLYGGVVDYLDFFGLLKNNLADYLIFFGILILFISTLFKPVK